MKSPSGKTKTASFARVFPVLLVVAILFQLLLEKDQLYDINSALNVILKTFGTSLFVSLIAAGAFVLFTRDDDQD